MPKEDETGESQPTNNSKPGSKYVNKTASLNRRGVKAFEAFQQASDGEGFSDWVRTLHENADAILEVKSVSREVTRLVDEAIKTIHAAASNDGNGDTRQRNAVFEALLYLDSGVVETAREFGVHPPTIGFNDPDMARPNGRYRGQWSVLYKAYRKLVLQGSHPHIFNAIFFTKGLQAYAAYYRVLSDLPFDQPNSRQYLSRIIALAQMFAAILDEYATTKRRVTR